MPRPARHVPPALAEKLTAMFSSDLLGPPTNQTGTERAPGPHSTTSALCKCLLDSVAYYADIENRELDESLLDDPNLVTFVKLNLYMARLSDLAQEVADESSDRPPGGPKAGEPTSPPQTTSEGAPERGESVRGAAHDTTAANKALTPHTRAPSQTAPVTPSQHQTETESHPRGTRASPPSPASQGTSRPKGRKRDAYTQSSNTPLAELPEPVAGTRRNALRYFREHYRVAQSFVMDYLQSLRGTSFSSAAESQALASELNEMLHVAGLRLLDPESNRPGYLFVSKSRASRVPGGYFRLRMTADADGRRAASRTFRTFPRFNLGTSPKRLDLPTEEVNARADDKTASEGQRTPLVSSGRHSTSHTHSISAASQTSWNRHNMHSTLALLHNAECAEITLRTGATVTGALLYNPDIGRVRVIDVESENSWDIWMEDIASARELAKKPT